MQLTSDPVAGVSSSVMSIHFSWVPAEWGACSVTCGKGILDREVKCQASTGLVAKNPAQCGLKQEGVQKECELSECEVYRWKPSEFGPCSASCGEGMAERLVECYTADGFYVPDTKCPQPKPDSKKRCAEAPCSLKPASKFPAQDV